MPENPLESLIVEEIRSLGPMTFARFMNLALYHEPWGYYSSGRERIGAGGDFYTSPVAHPAFGALLTVQLAGMWEMMGKPSRFHVVELGAGTGVMARDIIEYSNHVSSDFADALEYVTIDMRHAHRVEGAHHVVSDGIPLRGITGCILSNEYLDAMPVHQVTMEDGKLRELYVGVGGGELVEVVGEPSTGLLKERLDCLGVTLAERQHAEINLGLDDLLRSLSESLESGYVLSVDYGHEASGLYSSSRSQGTLMCHYRHTANSQPFRRIGRQDITAHVDFTTLMQMGKRWGLQACGLVSQRDFLGNLGIVGIRNGLRDLRLPSSRYNANMMGLGNLIDPEGLGGFKVCIQAKGVGAGRLSGLGGEGPIFDGGLPVPLLTDRHVNLLEGKYPHMAWDAGPELGGGPSAGRGS